MLKNEKNIKNNKKAIIIACIVAVVILAIAGIVIWRINKNEGPQVGQSKTIKLYEELIQKGKYNFNTFLNEENKVFYSKGEKEAYLDSTFEGRESKYVIKNGNSYLLNDEDMVFYTYHNNEMGLRKIETELEKVKGLECVSGKETIGNKEYNYEEYNVATNFMFKFFDTLENKNVKTTFYYDGSKLAYIKTKVGDYEELLRVDISYNVNSELFEIPANYKEA